MFLLSIIDFNLLKDRILKHDLLTMAAALAFYSALALSPLMVLLMSFLGSLNLGLQHQLIFQVQELMGDEASALLETVIASMANNQDLIAKADAWSIGVVLFSASVVFAQLQSCLNTIFDSPETEMLPTKWWSQIAEFLVRRLVCIGVMIVFVLISVASLTGSAFLSLIVTSEYKDLISVIHHSASFAIYSFVFALVFKWMPDRQVSWPASLQGGAITAVLFVGGKILIGFYLGHAAVGSAYGAAGSLVVFLAWIFYSSLIVLLGAEFSALLSPAADVKAYRRVGVETVLS